MGYVHFEQYPTSNRLSNLFLPFPTFQYRGEVLRADDREGTRAYLYKTSDWALELSGGVYPALNSNDNDARTGMDNLPWVLLIGPQAVKKFGRALEFKIGFFQAIATDLVRRHFDGQEAEIQVAYKWDHDFQKIGFMRPGPSNGKLSYVLRAGSREFLGTYFDVPVGKATPSRPAYDAQSGLLGGELSYFESVHSGRASIYFGVSATDYRFSANRESPLHKSDGNITYLVGLTYVLGESEKRSIPIEDTEGVVNKIRERNEMNQH